MKSKIYRITRVTKSHVYVRWCAFGDRSGLSRRIPIEVFRRDWIRLPHKEARLKSKTLYEIFKDEGELAERPK